MKIVVATTNQGKLKEIQTFFQGLQISLVSQSDFAVPPVEETGLSFVENALIKARHASHYCHLPALADDSGLVVDALDGAPGIYSSRYAGTKANDQDNIQKLLAALSSVSENKRQAHFYCALAFVRHPLDPAPLICQARWEGRILHQPKGEDGFGYDPIFWVPAQNCSAAELSLAQKNSLSHRAQALKAFASEFKKTIQSSL